MSTNLGLLPRRLPGCLVSAAILGGTLCSACEVVLSHEVQRSCAEIAFSSEMTLEVEDATGVHAGMSSSSNHKRSLGAFRWLR